ncbi:MAG: hypothetical protein AAF202_01965 [Pseudomonadota bacterium]
MQNQFQQRERRIKPSERVFSVIMKRLTKWVFNRYDCEIRHEFFENENQRHQILKSLLEKNPYARVDGELHFPIRFSGEIIGVVLAREAHDELSTSQQKELNHLFSLMIEPTLKDVEQLEMVDSLHEHMAYAHDNENLVRFKEYSKQPTLNPTVITPESKLRTRFHLPCVIDSTDADDARKLAFEIHQQSGRYAFLSIGELDESCFRSLEDLQIIGPVTIFIPELRSLTSTQVEFFNRYFKEGTRNADSPQFVVNVSNLKSFKEMADDNQTQLLESLSVAVIKMDRPFAELKKVGLVNLFFSALSGRQGHPLN